MKQVMRSHSRQHGLSLIEMMIAMLIGSILMFGVIQVFIASQAASRLSEGVARAQENGRFAIDFLERDIRMAGHMGCVNDQAHVVQNSGSPQISTGATSGDASPLDFSVAIQGYEAAGTSGGSATLAVGGGTAPTGVSAAITKLSPAPAKGSDILVLRFLAAEGVPISAITTSGSNADITMDATRLARVTEGGVASPTLFGIADCNQADVFRGTLGTGKVTATGTTLRAYSPLAKLYRAESLVYYVGSNANGEPGLRRARGDSAGNYSINEELVEGVENMQLLYGLDTTDAINSTTPPAGNITVQQPASGVTTANNATGAAQWRRVGSVQVGLVLRSPGSATATAATQDTGKLSVLGVSYDPSAATDGRYRTTYEVTIALRNRLFGN